MPIDPGTALSVGSGILGTGLGIKQYFDSARDEKKARQELSRLKTPFYKIQDEYIQNQNMARETAQGGLPVATKNFLQEQSDRGFGSAMQGISAAGGNPNDYADLFDSYNKSIRQTAAQDAAAQLENIKNLMAVNKDVAGQKTTQWAINEYQPYQNKLKELTQRIAAAKQNQMGGMQTAIGSVGAVGTALQNNSLMSKLFPNPTQPADQRNLPTTFAQAQTNAVGEKPVLPTFSPSSTTFRPYQSQWEADQEAATLYNILGTTGVM